MSKLDKIRLKFRKWKIYFLFLFSVLAIVFMFPQKGKFRYEFQKGKPWSHETLIAPFDFPIYKTESEVQFERDSVLSEFEPYFRMDTSVLQQQLSLFNDEVFPEARRSVLQSAGGFSFDTTNSFLFESDSVLLLYKSGIQTILREIYESGIMDDPVRYEQISKSAPSIKIIRNQVVEDRPVQNIFTQKSGYQYFTSGLENLALRLQINRDAENSFISHIDPVKFISPNLSYDETTSQRMMETFASELSLTQGMIQTGEKIIAVGEPVTEEKYLIIQSLKREYETNPNVLRNYNIIFAGRFALVFIVFFILYMFLNNFKKEILQSGTKTFFILMFVVLMSFLASLAIKSDTLNLYVLPFVVLPIIVKTFFDARTAVFIHLITILLIGFWAPNGFEFVFLNFIAGMVTIFSLKNLYKRRVLFFSSILVFASYSMVYTGINILQEGRIQDIEVLTFAWFAGNALLILSSYPLLYIFEKIFGFISDATLVELADTNQPLLRKLAEHAPGTFQHSIQVANLSEEAAIAIGANPLLIRTGALYHDIGKIENPMLFIENLTSNYNPHDNLEFSESAKKIIAHVSRGVELGRKYNLPDIIVDFIRTHHGTSTVQYFYRSYLKKYPEAEVDVAIFSYPGPKPFSKETAILMMADSVEAASRSLKVINKEVIRDLVDKIIDYQFKENQFEHVDITLKDISTIKDIFRKRLMNIYHARVEYPG